MIFFLGPLPPPVHGFSTINQTMLSRLLKKSEVHIFNTSPGLQQRRALWRPLQPLRPLLRLLAGFRQFLSFLILAVTKRPNALYVGLSGGMGQIFDTFYILVARLCGANIFLHHHSFVYVNAPKAYNRVCLWLAKDACHITLCDVMAEKLSSTYHIPHGRICILSNAAFLEEGRQPFPVQRPARDVLTLGFISNIILEKGIVEFFDVIACLTQQGFRVKGLIAGPVDDTIKDTFFSMLKEHKEIEYVGPVYEEKKEAYFQSIDMLLFPTKYKNEAEPLTILEALRDGIPVIAANRGCIRSIIKAHSGTVCPEIDHFVEDASEYIKSVLHGTLPLHTLSENAFKQFRKMHSIHQERLDDLVEKIAMTRQWRKPAQA